MDAAVWAAHPEWAALRRHVFDNQERLMEILAQWDDGDGCTSAKEFRQAWRVLELDAGLSIPAEVVSELYDECDFDSTGNIPFDDLALALKHLEVPEHRKQASDLKTTKK